MPTLDVLSKENSSGVAGLEFSRAERRAWHSPMAPSSQEAVTVAAEQVFWGSIAIRIPPVALMTEQDEMPMLAKRMKTT